MSGRDYRDDFPDPRPARLREQHRAAVAGQATALGQLDGRAEFQAQVDEARTARRSRRPDRLRFESWTDGAGQRSLVRPGDLLVARTVAYDVTELRALDDQGFDVEPVGGLDDRVLLCRHAELPASELHRIAEGLRSRGHLASVDHVVPLAPVAKGRTGVEPSEVGVALPSARTLPGAGVRVAVVDTGITAEQRTDGWLATVLRGDDVDPLDDLPVPDGHLDFAAGHGTFVAGIVAQVAPGADLRVYRAVDSDGIGSELEIARALVRAVREGAQVVNLSAGVQTVGDQPPVALQAAVDILAEQHPDVVVVAAAGNDSSDRPCWPAAFREVVSVAALDRDLRPASWSNHGPWVDCSSVGEGLLSTYVEGEESSDFDRQPDAYPPNAWAVWTGTSFAAPQVAGLVARIAGDRRISAQEAWRAVQHSAVRLPDFGRVVPVLPGT